MLKLNTYNNDRGLRADRAASAESQQWQEGTQGIRTSRPSNCMIAPFSCISPSSSCTVQLRNYFKLAATSLPIFQNTFREAQQLLQRFIELGRAQRCQPTMDRLGGDDRRYGDLLQGSLTSLSLQACKNHASKDFLQATQGVRMTGQCVLSGRKRRIKVAFLRRPGEYPGPRATGTSINDDAMVTLCIRSTWHAKSCATVPFILSRHLANRA